MIKLDKKLLRVGVVTEDQTLAFGRQELKGAAADAAWRE